MKIARWTALVLVVCVAVAACSRMGNDWRDADRSSAGIAPAPMATPEAVVQVYGARAFSWRGVFGVHTWISVKPSNAQRYTVYEIVGWRVRGGGDGLVISHRPPDGRWYGAEPELILERRGAGVDEMIEAIDAAARAYPYRHTYQVWPGPNSNTFTAHVGREVPGLRLDLPPTAIGKDYLDGALVEHAPSNTGYQASLFGLLGGTVAEEEGLEINVFGLVFGIDPASRGVKLPLVGALSLND